MIESGNGANALGEQVINQAVVKIQAAFIDGTSALWQDTRPGERETIGAQGEFDYERDILLLLGQTGARLV